MNTELFINIDSRICQKRKNGGGYGVSNNTFGKLVPGYCQGCGEPVTRAVYCYACK
jgi:hypothetical protein